MSSEIHIQPRTPEAARAEIERTRARMSETIDEIEGVLLQKKEQIQDQLDVRARIRAKPLHAAGIVLGIGVVIGFLTGGGGEPTEVIQIDDRGAARWERRARRLLRIAREQERDLEALQLAVHDLAIRQVEEADWEDEEEYDEDGGEGEGFRQRVADLAEGASARFGDLLASTIRGVVQGVDRIR
jgi:hypothetical protein